MMHLLLAQMVTRAPTGVVRAPGARQPVMDLLRPVQISVARPVDMRADKFVDMDIQLQDKEKMEERKEEEVSALPPIFCILSPHF